VGTYGSKKGSEGGLRLRRMEWVKIREEWEHNDRQGKKPGGKSLFNKLTLLLDQQQQHPKK